MASADQGGLVRAYWVLTLGLLLASMPCSSSLDRPCGPSTDTEPLLDVDDDLYQPGSTDVPAPISGFMENRGQLDDDAVLFYAKKPDGGIAFMRSEVRITLVAGLGPTAREGVCSCIGLTFPGSNDVIPEGRHPEGGGHNFFIGNEPSQWRSEIKSFQEVVYQNIYEGVDLIYSVHDGVLKYEFVLEPYMDPSVISVHVAGHEGLRLDGDGELVIGTRAGEIRDGGLNIFYRDDHADRVAGDFAVETFDTYRFDIAPHDPARGLVIDPVIFSTFLGGESNEYCSDVTTDEDMNVYMVGQTDSYLFPRIPGDLNRSVGESLDVFVSKLTRDGSLVFTALIGGSGTDDGTGVAVDGHGDIYVTGYTLSNDFPVTVGPLGPTLNGTFNGFIFKLTVDGSSLELSTLMGGSDQDLPEAIAVGGNGDIYVTGSTRSWDFPTVEGAVQETLGGLSDAFLSRIASNGSVLLNSTYLGGDDFDYGEDLAIDDQGAVYIAGRTTSQNFPTTPEAYDVSLYGQSYDAFITKFEPNCSALNFSTFLGGLGWEEGASIVLDKEGDVVVGGTTYSEDLFPITPDAFQGSFGGGYSDGFVSKLSSNGRSLLYSTFFGGNQSDNIEDIGLNITGCVYITGYTRSTGLPTTPDAFKSKRGGFHDAFLFKIDPVANRTVYGTYLGGSESDYGNCLAVASSEFVFVAGDTFSGSFRTTVGAFQPTKNMARDCFIVGFNTDTACPVANAGPDRIAAPHEPVVLNSTSSRDNVGIANWTWSFSFGEVLVEFYGPEPEFTFHIPGVYVVDLRVQDAVGHLGRDIVHVVVPDAGTDIVTTVGSRVWFDAFGFSSPLDTIDWSWTYSYHGERKDIEGPVFNFIFERTGVFQVALCVTDSLGNRVDDGFTVTVLTEDGSLADAGPDITVDQFVPLHLEAFDQMEGIMVCSWRILYNGSWVEMTGDDPNMTFHVVGTYEANLWMRDTNGGPHSDTMTITVIDREPPVAFVGTDLVVDQFTTVEFDGTASNDNIGIVKWVFSFVYDEMVVYLYDARANFTFDIPGEYEVSLKVADAIGNNDIDQLTLTVLDITPPVAFAGSGQMVDQHATVSFDGGGSSDNEDVVNWTWNFSYAGSEVTLFGAFPSFFFDDAGSYPVTLTVRDLAGFNDTDVITIVVRDTTSPVAFAGEDVVVTTGDAVSFNGGNSTDNVGIVNYTWTLDYRGAPITLYGEAPEFMFEKVGEYLVTLVVLDSELHSSSDSLRVFVKEVERTSSWDDRMTLAVALAVIGTLGFLGWRWSRRGSR